MTDEQKLVLIYSVELGIFSIVFLVLGILKILNIWTVNDTRALIFNIITTVGAVILLGDFIWAMFSKKRRKRISLLDKILNMPLSILFLVLAILSYVNRANGLGKLDYHDLIVGIGFLYASINFGFQALYHYKHPLPAVMAEIKKMKEELAEQSKQQEKQVEKIDNEKENHD